MCIPQGQRKKVVVAHNTRHPESPIRDLDVTETATFLCQRCGAYPACFVCKEESVLGSSDHHNGTHDAPIVIDGDDNGASPEKADEAPIEAKEPSSSTFTIAPNLIPSNPAPLLYRCKRCKQASHYEHRELSPCRRSPQCAVRSLRARGTGYLVSLSTTKTRPRTEETSGSATSVATGRG